MRVKNGLSGVSRGVDRHPPSVRYMRAPVALRNHATGGGECNGLRLPDSRRHSRRAFAGVKTAPRRGRPTLRQYRMHSRYLLAKNEH